MPERDHAMMQVSERLRDFLGFGVLLVLLAVLLVVPHEIPKEIQGDFPAEVYPRTLLVVGVVRSEEHTSELQSLMRISYAVFCLKKKTNNKTSNSNRLMMTYYAQHHS